MEDFGVTLDPKERAAERREIRRLVLAVEDGRVGDVDPAGELHIEIEAGVLLLC